MKKQRICIVGDGLSGLTSAIVLNNILNIEVHLISNKGPKKKDKRTTAISDSNFQYIKKDLNLIRSSFFWPCKKINLFFEDKKKITNFLNFEEKNKNLMYIFQNKDLKKKLCKLISKIKKIKIIKKSIKNINKEEGFVSFGKKKNFMI